jgi:hypothetical protein
MQVKLEKGDRFLETYTGTRYILNHDGSVSKCVKYNSNETCGVWQVTEQTHSDVEKEVHNTLVNGTNYSNTCLTAVAIVVVIAFIIMLSHKGN